MRTALAVAFLGLMAWGGLLAQRPFREWPAIEYEGFHIPPDWNHKTEWTRARLRYPDIVGYPGTPQTAPRYQNGELFPGYWTMDYPRSDRHLLEGVRRLTRIDSRSVEQVVDLEGSDDIFNWPIVYGVEVGHWLLPDDQAKQFREYLLRGGFFMCDDFHGAEASSQSEVNEWGVFTESMSKVFPDRQIEDIPDNDPIFHTIYDLHERFQ